MVLMLVLFNWLAATLQWIRLQPSLSFGTSLREILMGHFAGMHTPLKLGDAWVRSREGADRRRGVEAFITHLMLLGAMGVVAAVHIAWQPAFLPRPDQVSGSMSWLNTFLNPRIILGIILGSVVAFHFFLFLHLVRKRGWATKLIFVVYGLALSRVLAFEVAASILFEWAYPGSHWSDWWPVIATVYLLGSVVPIGSFFDFALRSSILVAGYQFAVQGAALPAFVFFIHSVLHSYVPALVGGWLWWRKPIQFSV